MNRNLVQLGALSTLALCLAVVAPANVSLAKSAKPGSKVEGTITAVDVAGQTATITTASAKAVTVKVTSATKIERNGAHVSLGALKVGDRGQALYDPKTMVATKLEGKSRTLMMNRAEANLSLSRHDVSTDDNSARQGEVSDDHGGQRGADDPPGDDRGRRGGRGGGHDDPPGDDHGGRG